MVVFLIDLVLLGVIVLFYCVDVLVMVVGVVLFLCISIFVVLV